ncbi:2OG-Fe(II) oxygenase [Flavobacterium enshiense DK69]|uniref:Oxidoreductase n=1 Tax=Flavobacterium enshiense DK69 TaxID=1107311 RepID=V6SH52_9FLAO|nr:2OG-Fe(II) oxygenase [Flavobacterium enshiense]ESU23720.1 2OG-Fe(II) oxygenase [Flavobacterium enshiense DK69]KGO96149.1 oxidoreductase [Flavobacterium enshiense DK69]
MTDFEINPKYEMIIDDLMNQKFSIADNFFAPDEVALLRKNLLRKFDERNFKKSAIGNQDREQIAEEVRGDFILWLDEQNADEAEQLYFERINDFVRYLNRTCFLGIQDMEFHYALYPEGTFYKRHLDTFQNDSRRKLSMVCYLNEEHWQMDYGGELTIYKNEDGNETELNVVPVQGRMVIFESQVLEHEVKPVRQPRLSITGWLKTR